MKIKLHCIVVGLALFFLGGCSDKDDDPKIEHTKTIIAYLIGDSNLSGVMHNNISAMEVGMKSVATPGSTLVVYYDGEEDEFSSPTLFKYTINEKGKLSERAILKIYDEQNSVSESVMRQVLTDARNYCPADNYGLIFGSHGSAWLPAAKTESRAIGGDNDYYINIPNLADVLSKSSMYYDFILMDICLMSTVEVAYELKDLTDYLVVSPTEVIDIGFPYTKLMSYLFQRDNQENALIQVAKEFVDYYDVQPTNRRWGTMAVLKTSEMDELAAEVTSIMADFGENASGFNITGLQQYGRAVQGHDKAIFDFAAFIRRLTNNAVPASFEQQLNKVVVYKGFVEDAYLGTLTIDANSYSGIGCYVLNASYNSSWNNYYKQLQWYKAAGIDKVNW